MIKFIWFCDKFYLDGKNKTIISYLFFGVNLGWPVWGEFILVLNIYEASIEQSLYSPRFKN